MLFHAVPDRALDDILANVSRSFYLSLAILPRSMRTQLSVGYLVARAADTVADTRVIEQGQRLALLGQLRAALDDPELVVPYVADVRRAIAPDAAAASPAERVLIERLGDCLRALHRFEDGDRARTRHVLDALLTGMERDLQRFPDGGAPVALETMAELDEHCYAAAGCVGEYWTLMTAAHVPSAARLKRPDLVARGVRLGKALQMVNVIRDAPADLAQGRCYFPRELLARHGFTPEALTVPDARRGARALLDELHALALAHVDASFPYVLAIPRRAPRLRLAALWPLWIGLATLERLRAAPDPLAPCAQRRAGCDGPAQPIKISRSDVYRIVAESSMVVGADRLLESRHAARRRRAAGG